MMETPGIYVHRDASAVKAENYVHFVPLFGDGVFWAVKLELLVDRTDYIPTPRKTDQWIQPSRSTRIIALWVCGRPAKKMHKGDMFRMSWNGKLEANPSSSGVAIEGDDEVKHSVGRGSSSQRSTEFTQSCVPEPFRRHNR